MISSFSGPHRFLSNFYPSPLVVLGTLYPTVEHLYQASKTKVYSERAAIAAAPTPGKAKRLGRNVTLRPDWETIKVEVMREALLLKFAIPHLAALLLETGDAPLVEGNAWGDRFWGQCSLGVGDNHLGRLLAEVRDSLRTPPRRRRRSSVASER